MQVVAIHDVGRKPASWADIIRPGQFVAFATPSDGTCILFDALAEARAFCEAAVQSGPAVRFDVFDAQGRANPPLLTMVHPSREQLLDTHPRVLHRRRVLAWALIAGGIPLILYAYWKHRDLDIVFPAFIGINMILAGGRLLWLNLGIRETERARQERLKRLDG